MQGLVRHLGAVRRTLRERPTSVDLERVEFAPLVRLLGIPFVQMLHGEGAPKLKMDSLLKSYRFVHNLNERLAVMACDKFLCVNPIITERIRATYPRYAAKIDTLSTWVDTATFRPRPLPEGPGLRIAYAGRLDLFKSPPLMFKTIAELHRRLGDGVEFHYLGTSDPHRFPEFRAIEAITVRHGFKDAKGVARVFANVHAGILTSEFEGMPFYVLECLAAGRPICAVHLPQLECVVKSGASGALVARSGDEDDVARRLAEAFVGVREKLASGEMTPEIVAAQVADYTPERQLARCYANHREIQARRFAARTESNRPRIEIVEG